ncbi:hypothetical protein BCS71_25880, partial [Vibrio lentus]
ARGRLTSTDERQTIVTLILEAKQCGCRLEPACHEVQIDLRTYRRWYQQGEVQADKESQYASDLSLQVSISPLSRATTEC